jgi:7-cyano-7-deazaguanine synthase
MDSIALAYWYKPQYAFTIDYGQMPAEAEIAAASNVAAALKIQHEIIRVDCSSLGSGDLLKRESSKLSKTSEWWPYRNQLLITLACMKAISSNMSISELMVASVKDDGTHKDGTRGFYSRMNKLMSYQEGKIRIQYPVISKNSVSLIKDSKIPHEILFWAHSCHTSNQPCGTCPGCKKYLYVLRGLKLD